jgi:amino acid transporter/mannitol/fructose-specific phosphotransferase system IIA component (Ntr-type)
VKSVLKKELTTFGLFAIATGAMISSGIFVLPSVAYKQFGPFVFLSYALAGILAFLGLLSFLELATAMPKAGADYFYTSRSLGPFVGTISGIFAWAAITLKSAFATVGLSIVLSAIFGIDPFLVTLAFTIFFVGINILGVKVAANIQIVFVILMISTMILHSAKGLFQINIAHFSIPSKFSFLALLQGTAFVFVSYGGLIKSAALSEEAKNPTKDLPRGLIFAILFVTVLSTLYTFVIIGTLPKPQLETTLTPASDSAKIVWDEVGYFMITLASLLAFITTANAGIMSASRYLLALSRDHLLPPLFSVTSDKRGTPHFSLIFTGVTILLVITTLPLKYLVKFASATILMAYVLGSLAVIIFRESKIRTYNPKFKVPLYPYLPIFCILIFTFLFIETGTKAIEVIIGMLLVSILVYRFYGRLRAKKDFALLYVMKRILSEKDTEDLLEAELEEIIVHREEIPKYEFSNLIKSALVVDLNKPVEFSELTDIVLEKIPFDKEESKKALMNYGKVDNFIINEYFALPHGIIQGESKFFMGIVRNNNGIIFKESGRKVVGAFYIVSSSDMREFYLKVLASIAERIRAQDFWIKWQRAKNSDDIRRLLLK